MATSKWNNFTQEDYDSLYTKLASGEIILQKDVQVDPETGKNVEEDGKTIPIAAPTDLGAANVTVDYIAE